MQRMQTNVARAASEDPETASHPLLVRREEKRILLLVITGDRGLAGAFNASVIKSAQRFIADRKDAEIELELMGRKGRDFFRKRHRHISGEYSTLFVKAVNYEDVLQIARKATEKFRNAEVDAVYMVLNQFKTVVTPELTVSRILPIELPESKERIDYIYEQPPRELLSA